MSESKKEQPKQEKKMLPESILKDCVRVSKLENDFLMQLSDGWDDLVAMNKGQATEIEKLNKLLSLKSNSKPKLKPTKKQKGKN